MAARRGACADEGAILASLASYLGYAKRIGSKSGKQYASVQQVLAALGAALHLARHPVDDDSLEARVPILVPCFSRTCCSGKRLLLGPA